MTYASDTTALVVDIETCGLPNAGDYLDPVVPDGRLTDPLKIAADIKAKTESREERLSLDWNVGRIAAIAWWTEQDGISHVVCPNEQVERYALTEFWDSARHRSIVGFNVKGFDLRFIVQRSRYLGVPHPWVDFGKYSEKGVIDLYLKLTFSDGIHDKGEMRRSLKAFCKRFGIPVDDAVSGKDVPALIAAGEWEKVREHVISDVNLTVELARKLGVVRAQVEAPIL